MKTFKSKLQGIGMMLLFTFVTIQTMSASAQAGEYKVNEGYTVTIALADPYKRTLMQSTGITYSWYSENNSYATVVSSTRYNATVRGVKPTSSCKVYFKCSYFIDGYYRTMDFYYDIKVVATNVSVTSVSLSQSSASINEGNTLQLNAYVYPTNATNRNVNWTSNNTSVATVSKNGLVTAKGAGVANIIVTTTNNLAAICTITVKEQTTGVQVNQEELEVKICNGTIVLNEVADVNVYRINGTMVFSGRVQTIEGLDRGIYIVRIGSRSKKVIL